MTPIPTCPACQEPLHTHAQCCGCRCLMHRNVMCRYDPAICKDCDAALFKRGARRCRTCEKVKAMARFQSKPGTYYRDCSFCRSQRPARRAAHAAWRERNRDQERQRQRQYRAEHIELERTRVRALYHKHRPKRLAYAKHYRATHHEAHRARWRAYSDANRARINATARARYQRRKLAVWFGR